MPGAVGVNAAEVAVRFAPDLVAALVRKFRDPKAMVSETDEMALAGSMSLMILHERLVAKPRLAPALEPSRLVVGDRVVSPVDPVAEAV